MRTQKYKPEHTNSAISFHASVIDASLNYSNKIGKCSFLNIQICAITGAPRTKFFLIFRVLDHIFAFAFHLCMTVHTEHKR